MIWDLARELFRVGGGLVNISAASEKFVVRWLMARWLVLTELPTGSTTDK